MRVRAPTDGRGVDHVVELGGPDALRQSMPAKRMGGHIVLIGMLSGLEHAAALSPHAHVRVVC